MTPNQIVPPLLQEASKKLNMLRAEAMISEEWEGLPGSPLTPNVLKSLAKSALELAADWDQMQWLIDTVRKGCERRPAPIEMRRIFTMRYPAADGLSDDMADKSDHMGGFKKRPSEN